MEGSDDDCSNVKADDAVFGLAGGVVVHQRAFSPGAVEHHVLNRRVGTAELRRLAMRHDGIHHPVADGLHLARVQVMRSGRTASEADSGQPGHLADELDAVDGLGGVEAGFVDDLRHSDDEQVLVELLFTWYRDRGLDGGASGHAGHLFHILLFPGWVQLGQDYKLLHTTMQLRRRHMLRALLQRSIASSWPHL